MKSQNISEIEALRKELKKDKRRISVVDYGAGSVSGARQERSISEIAKLSLKNKKYAALLYRMVKYFHPSVILELGSCLGITTCYLAKANTKAKVVSIEGCSEINEIAKSIAKKLAADNIEFISGNFDTLLDKTVSEYHPEFIFFDGNHTEEATVRYFETCLHFVKNESIFIFDDINWSDGMKNAWTKIKEHSQVTVSIDLHFIGIVFFRKELSKEDFVIRF